MNTHPYQILAAALGVRSGARALAAAVECGELEQARDYAYAVQRKAARVLELLGGARPGLFHPCMCDSAGRSAFRAPRGAMDEWSDEDLLTFARRERWAWWHDPNPFAAYKHSGLFSRARAHLRDRGILGDLD